MSEVSQAAAMAAKLAAIKAAQINAKLAAKGIPIQHQTLPPRNPQVQMQQMKTKPEILYAEIMINDLDNRGYMLKSTAQEQICQWTGANIVTRGRYIKPQDRHKLSGEKPLFIHISARSRPALDRAVHYVLTTMKQRSIPEGSKYMGAIDPTLIRICERDLKDAAAPFTEKVYCGSGDMVIPRDMKERVLGPNNAYFQHIIHQTKARLTLRGRQSGHKEIETGQELFEPMFVQINHGTIEGMVEAKNLVDSLLYTVHEKIKAEKRQPQFSTQYPVSQQQPGASFSNAPANRQGPPSPANRQGPLSPPNTHPSMSPPNRHPANSPSVPHPPGAHASFSPPNQRAPHSNRSNVPHSNMLNVPRKRSRFDRPVPGSNQQQQQQHYNTPANSMSPPQYTPASAMSPPSHRGGGNIPTHGGGNVSAMSPGGNGHIYPDRSFPRSHSQSQQQVMRHTLVLNDQPFTADPNSRTPSDNMPNIPAQPQRSLMHKAGFTQFKIPEYKKPVKRRFQEEFKVPRKKRFDSDDDKFKMPPPPGPINTGPISAGNVAEWTKEIASSGKKKSRRGRDHFNRTIVCDYSDSDED